MTTCSLFVRRAFVATAFGACMVLAVLPSRWTRASAVADQQTDARVESNTSSAPPDFDRMLRRQAATDTAWRRASTGFMRMEKISYRSRAGDLDVPAFVFQPLARAGQGERPGIVWVHENIRGHLYEHYIPYIREATRRGYVVLAPEYRGSVGYGQPYYDAIDYGGAEVDDVVTAVAVLAQRYPEVDPRRVGIIGWSHGGMITLLGVLKNPGTFGAAVAIAPVTNLFHRLAAKGVDAQLRAIDPHGRFGGLPWQRPDVYRDRSPLFHVDELRDPLLVHMADNDEDVTIEEGAQLVDALVARRPSLAETRIYHNPRGGHLFDRQVDSVTFQPDDTSEQVDSWRRVWAFFERHVGERR